MRKKIEWQWELIDECTWRAKTIGGWLVLHVKTFSIKSGKTNSFSQSESMQFVADRDHEWTITAPFNPSDPGKIRQKVDAKDFEA